MAKIEITAEELDILRRNALSEVDHLTAKLRSTIDSYFDRFNVDKQFTWTMYRGNPAHTGSIGATDKTPVGKLRYNHAIGAGVQTAPTVTTKHIFTAAADGHELHCLSLDSGELVWKLSFHGKITTSVATSWDGFAYVACDDNYLYSVGIETGLIRWRFRTDDIIQNTPCVDGTMVFVTTRDGLLVCLNAMNGQMKWVSPWESAFSEPITHKRSVYFGTYDGCLLAVYEGSGDTRWKTPSLGKATSCATLDEKRVFYSLPESSKKRGKLYCLDVKSGKQLWVYDTLDSLHCAGVVSHNRLFIVAQNYLEVLDVEDAQRLWSVGVDDTLRTCPTVISEAVIVGDSKNKLHSFEVTKGKEQWKLQFDAPFVGAPAYSNGLLVLVTEDGKLHAIE
jgi:outer membrane protein assembly factor BamB